ncbi:MAG: MMPL family transporter [Planctomycetota bacterium]
MKLGSHIYRRRWWVLLAWILLTAALWVFTPRIDPSENERQQFLPPHTDYVKAVKLWGKAFWKDEALSQAVIVFERSAGPLSADDRVAIERVAEYVRHGAAPGEPNALRPGDMEEVTVVSPGSVGVPELPLVNKPIVPNPQIAPGGPSGQAATIMVNLPSNFISLHADRFIGYLHELLTRVDLPEGLEVAVSGSAGFGSDYALSAKRSHERTSVVTLIAVIVILLIVYRAPVAAAIPLAGIGMASVVVLKSLSLGELVDFHTGTAERIFVFVLMYGAGIDYSVLLISRYRESLQEAMPPARAAIKALDASLPAIAASAGTDAAGLMMLSFGQFGIFVTTGPAVGLSLLVAAAASITLVPALLAIFGRWVFWPAPTDRWRAGLARDVMDRRRVWPTLAKIVTRRPVLILCLAVLLLAAPVVRGATVPWLYDALSGFRVEKRPNGVGNAASGVEMAARHWPRGEIAATTALIHAGEPHDAETWLALSKQLSNALDAVDDVSSVRTLAEPFGKSASPWQNFLAREFGGAAVAEKYLSPDGKTLRVDVVLGLSPLTPEAMDVFEEVRSATRGALADSPVDANAHFAGATAEMVDVRKVTRRDMLVISLLTMGTIFVLVYLLLRDAVLSGFMIVATLLSYFATLGVSWWVLTTVLGEPGLDWKVEIFLFVVMVAVGQDYNIFLAARLAEESKHLPTGPAVRRALVHTGPVISSCGIIMAATLGSLMVGELGLMMQLGFALSAGMLIDTFLIRPMLLPAFAVLTNHTGRKGRVFGQAETDAD